MTTAQRRKIQERPVARPGDRPVRETIGLRIMTKKSSYKEHRVDALAPYADEGRGKLR